MDYRDDGSSWGGEWERASQCILQNDALRPVLAHTRSGTAGSTPMVPRTLKPSAVAHQQSHFSTPSSSTSPPSSYGDDDHSECQSSTLRGNYTMGSMLHPYSRYCSKNGNIKPSRGHHRRSCSTWVLRYNHHCPWVGGCVGAQNRKVRHPTSRFTLNLAINTFSFLVSLFTLLTPSQVFIVFLSSTLYLSYTLSLLSTTTTPRSNVSRPITFSVPSPDPPTPFPFQLSQISSSPSQQATRDAYPPAPTQRQQPSNDTAFDR
jgi:DHHC palmitoyltransferase